MNIYQEVTDRIIKQLENGVVPWHKPWHSSSCGAYNRISKKPYSFCNQLLLDYDGEYATYKQWQQLGGQVKKGEKSEMVVFWKFYDIEEENEKGEKVIKSVPVLRYYNVFHISQVEGVEPTKIETFPTNPINEAEKIINDYVLREGIKFKEITGARAFYRPATDEVVVPNKTQFESSSEYYATTFHELTHSTGHKSRLNRFNGEKVAAFGSQTYSKEELVAEMGSSFLMKNVGIETADTTINNAAYIQSWLKVLANDNKFVISAAGKAEKAVNYIVAGL